MSKKGSVKRSLNNQEQASVRSANSASGPISRREFVKTGSSILLVSGAACSDGTTPSVTGNIRLLLTGLHASATSGGTATAAPVAGGQMITINIPAAGDQTAPAPVGEYTVTYAPPSNHVLAAGVTVPSSVTVTEGQTTTITIGLAAVGTLQVTVTGLTGSPPNGGSASAQRTDAAGAPIAINVSALGSGSVPNVPVGTYTVTYAPPAGFTSSGNNPLTDVAVGFGATATAAFTVAGSVSTGTIHVTISGLTGAASGGSISARLTDNTGGTFTANLPAPTGGSSSADLAAMPAGSYNVTYTPPSGFQLAPAQSNPQVANVTASATTNVSWTAQQAQVPAGLVFAADWHTATGNTLNAVRDGTRWGGVHNIANPIADQVTVIAATGLNFPAGMANVLAIRYPEANQQFYGPYIENGWQLPPIGGSLYYRLYFRFAIGGTGGGTHHPFQSCVNAGGCCPQSWWKVQKPSATSGETIPLFIEQYGAASGGPHHHQWGVLDLTRNVTYRVEERYERTGTETWIVRARVYDESVSTTVPIRDESDFACGFSQNPEHGAHTMATALPILFENSSCLRGRMLVNQGVGLTGRGNDDPNANRIYYGGFAVSLSDWIGPYVPGEGVTPPA